MTITRIQQFYERNEFENFPPKTCLHHPKNGNKASITRHRLPNVNDCDDWNRVIYRSIREINFIIYNVLFSPPLITSVIDIYDFDLNIIGIMEKWSWTEWINNILFVFSLFPVIYRNAVALTNIPNGCSKRVNNT